MYPRTVATAALAHPRLADAWALCALKQVPSRRREPTSRPTPTVESALKGDVIVAVHWEDSEGQYELAELSSLPLGSAQPARAVLHHNRAVNSIAVLPMTKVNRVLVTESRAERSFALGVDLGGDYVDISSQPCTFTFADGTRHTPDFYIGAEPNKHFLVDVRPPAQRDLASMIKFRAARDACEQAGLVHVLHGGYEGRLDANLRFLWRFSGQPRLWNACEPFLQSLAQSGGHVTWGRLLALITAQMGLDPIWVRPIVGHAVWTGLLTVDLCHRLSDRTLLHWAPSNYRAVVR